ncbi:OmpH family outer membrane protein [Caulobacter sp. 17J80-11]|uniref:OmpH family outer membrane protein n=1 Tax=Caulobacter sp. 17J80-11 TaxID=2763502 RepID=UPI001653B98A|nr:OmpH family outer membrane protein [Caulobacter sp. 17J80-11]MBC6980764.1 OmpH family outer membrane protein [Caulobacter sp. 17J80-11]
MTLKFLSAAGALTVLALASGASAQTAPAAAPAVSGGPALPGVCVYSGIRTIATSAAGKAVETRMNQLEQAVEADLKSQATALDTEAKALQAQQATQANDPAFQQRVFSFNQKKAQFERKLQIRNKELEVTKAKAVERIAKEAQPLVQQAYTERNCSLMIDRSAVLAGNAQMDVTDLVISKLNAKLPPFSFERENLEQQLQQQAAAAAPKPAAPAAKK